MVPRAGTTHDSPTLGRVPTAIAQALFSGEGWMTTEDLAAQWFPAEGDRVRLPLLPELLVRFVQDLMEGEGANPRDPSPRCGGI